MLHHRPAWSCATPRFVLSNLRPDLCAVVKHAPSRYLHLEEYVIVLVDAAILKALFFLLNSLVKLDVFRPIVIIPDSDVIQSKCKIRWKLRKSGLRHLDAAHSTLVLKPTNYSILYSIVYCLLGLCRLGGVQVT